MSSPDGRVEGELSKGSQETIFRGRVNDCPGKSGHRGRGDGTSLSGTKRHAFGTLRKEEGKRGRKAGIEVEPR